MKARVARAFDINDPEKRLWCIMISQGRGKKSLPGRFNGGFTTEDLGEAKKVAKEYNEKNNGAR